MNRSKIRLKSFMPTKQAQTEYTNTDGVLGKMDESGKCESQMLEIYGFTSGDTFPLYDLAYSPKEFEIYVYKRRKQSTRNNFIYINNIKWLLSLNIS